MLDLTDACYKTFTTAPAWPQAAAAILPRFGPPAAVVCPGSYPSPDQVGHADLLLLDRRLGAHAGGLGRVHAGSRHSEWGLGSCGGRACRVQSLQLLRGCSLQGKQVCCARHATLAWLLTAVRRMSRPVSKIRVRAHWGVLPPAAEEARPVLFKRSCSNPQSRRSFTCFASSATCSGAGARGQTGCRPRR